MISGPVSLGQVFLGQFQWGKYFWTSFHVASISGPVGRPKYFWKSFNRFGISGRLSPRLWFLGQFPPCQYFWASFHHASISGPVSLAPACLAGPVVSFPLPLRMHWTLITTAWPWWRTNHWYHADTAGDESSGEDQPDLAASGQQWLHTHPWWCHYSAPFDHYSDVV